MMAMLPSLFLFAAPILEEDAVLMIAEDEFHFGQWLKAGRPVVDWLRLAFCKPWAYPAAHYVYSILFIAITAGFLFALAEFFAGVLRSRGGGYVLAAFFSFHFHMLEGRTFNGHYALLAMALVLAGFLLFDRFTVRGKPLAGAVAMAVGFFLALNTHQAGALVIASAGALLLASDLLAPQRRGLVPWARMAAAVLCGAAVYGIELFMIEGTIGLYVREKSSFGENFQAFVYSIPQWALCPVPRWESARPVVAKGLFLLALVAAAGAPPFRQVPLRLGALAIAAVGVLVTGIAPALTDGWLSSRVLLPALVGILGGIAMSGQGWFRLLPSRVGKAAAVGLLLFALAIHAYQFAFLLRVKHEDYRFAVKLHERLAAMGAKPGDTVNMRHSYPPATFATYLDSGRSLFTTHWGVSAIVEADVFSSSPAPPGLVGRFVRPPIDEFFPVFPNNVGRLADGVFGGDVALHNMRIVELEDRWLHPWSSTERLAVGRYTLSGEVILIGEGAWLDFDKGSGDIYFTPGQPPDGASLVAHPGVVLDRPWTFECEIEVLTEGVAEFVLGTRTPTAPKVLSETKASFGEGVVLFRAEGGPEPAMFWIGVRPLASQEKQPVVRVRNAVLTFAKK